jgi:hypothetical protein
MNKIKFISLLQINYTHIQTNVPVRLPQVPRMQPFISRALPHLPHFLPPRRCGPTLARASSFTRFIVHTQRRTAVGRTPLTEWSARCRDLYPTARNIQTFMTAAGFELTVSESERPQTHATAINIPKFQILPLLLEIPCISSSSATSAILKPLTEAHTSNATYLNCAKTLHLPYRAHF